MFERVNIVIFTNNSVREVLHKSGLDMCFYNYGNDFFIHELELHLNHSFN